jgi:RNA polymerase sigma factor (sigma-70 family)
MDDQKIITLIRTGKNDQALNALYRHYPLMRKMIRSRGGTTNDAEDIFQEALIILVRKIKAADMVKLDGQAGEGGQAKTAAFTLTAQLSTYLFSVCRYLWKDELKRRRHEVSSDFETGLTASEEQELGEAVDMEDRARLAEKVLHELKERCRELLLLFYEGRLRLKEIAVRMGYNSENTAKNQKYKCLEAAKNRLKELKQGLQTF